MTKTYHLNSINQKSQVTEVSNFWSFFFDSPPLLLILGFPISLISFSKNGEKLSHRKNIFSTLFFWKNASTHKNYLFILCRNYVYNLCIMAYWNYKQKEKTLGWILPLQSLLIWRYSLLWFFKWNILTICSFKIEFFNNKGLSEILSNFMKVRGS